ncbi:odorant receptor 63a-like [Onthophagus taurus]|uniref:odorant receptor 63a-like n=1 Tax=Onthophagus taurus TaxID=166361 RepID=UPI0039BEABAE
MKELTKSLQRLLRISSDIESIFQHIAFVQVIFSLFNLMCCLFMTTNLEAYSAAFFVQLQVYFALATQLSIYCIFAQNTSMAFSEIPFAIYQNEWFSVSKSLKSMMIINILRMNNPVVFTASKFVELSLPLLVKILRMSYSFYTVLRK